MVLVAARQTQRDVAGDADVELCPAAGQQAKQVWIVDSGNAVLKNIDVETVEGFADLVGSAGLARVGLE